MLKPLFGPVYIMADVIAIVADVVATALQIWLYCNGSWCYCYIFMIGWCYCQGGWCYCHFVCSVLADVVAMVVDVKTTQGRMVYGRFHSHFRLMLLLQVSIYFKFSSEMLHRTSSQICGRWYLPMFLLRDGLLALMYRASFMVLKRFWSSLPSMVKLSIVTSWPEVLWWSYIGDGALRCSFNLSSKFLADSPIYSSSQSTLSHLYHKLLPESILASSRSEEMLFYTISIPNSIEQHFLRPGRSQDGFWQKLVSQLKFCSVYEKSTSIYYIKQNEKHLYIIMLI